MEPMVSVVIPVYNRLDYLEVALNSVFNQTYRNYEVIVVDDGSTEDFTFILDKYGKEIRLFRNTNHGVAYSRNFGVQKANGKYIAFLDSDDFWEPKKLEIQVGYMEKTNAVWSQHSYKYYYEDGRKGKEVKTGIYKGNILPFLWTSFKVQTSCFMVRKEEIIKHQFRFDENKKYGEDGEFYRQISLLYPLISIDEVLGNFRIHGENAGKNVLIQIKERSYVYEKFHDDNIFLKHTSSWIRLMYKYCFAIKNVIGEKSKANTMLCKMLYVIPWLSFRMESKRLAKDGIKNNE